MLSYAKIRRCPAVHASTEVEAVVVETAKDYGYRVAAHAHGEEGMYRAVAGGVTSIEHGSYMRRPK